jgi:hypothetical protein
MNSLFKFNQPYPFKHWLTTLVFGPILFTLYYEINNLSNLFELYILTFSYGALFSLPAFLIYLIAFNLLKRSKLSDFLIKVYLNTGTIIGIFITLYIAIDTIFSEVGISYSIALVLSSSFLELNKNEHPSYSQADT